MAANFFLNCHYSKKTWNLTAHSEEFPPAPTPTALKFCLYCFKFSDFAKNSVKILSARDWLIWAFTSSVPLVSACPSISTRKFFCEYFAKSPRFSKSLINLPSVSSCFSAKSVVPQLNAMLFDSISAFKVENPIWNFLTPATATASCFASANHSAADAFGS